MRRDPFDIPMVVGFNKSDAKMIENQERINLYLTPLAQPGIAPFALRSIQGIVEVANPGSGSYFCRGYEVADGIPYIVLGTGLYSLLSDYTLTLLGTIPGIQQVSMAFNGTQLMILEPGGTGYIYNVLLGTLVEINDIDFRANGNPQYVVFVDSYFLCTTDQKKWIISRFNDGTDWQALDVATAEVDPDAVVAPAIIGNMPMIFGTQTAQQFSNQPTGSGFPYQRTGFVMPKGLTAPLSLRVSNDQAYFIGRGKDEKPAVWTCSVNSYTKVSTDAVDAKIQNLNQAEIESIRAWNYSEDGQSFVGFNLPDTTLVYSVTTGQWDERKSYLNNQLTTWRVHSVFPAYGQMFCTDTIDGRIGVFTDDAHTEYGNRMVKQWTLSPFMMNSFSFSVPEINLLIQTGLLNLEAPDETIHFEQSYDGYIWNNIRERSLGKTGNYKQPVVWNRNGSMSRMVVWRFQTSVDAKIVIARLYGTIVRADK